MSFANCSLFFLMRSDNFHTRSPFCSSLALIQCEYKVVSCCRAMTHAHFKVSRCIIYIALVSAPRSQVLRTGKYFHFSSNQFIGEACPLAAFIRWALRTPEADDPNHLYDFCYPFHHFGHGTSACLNLPMLGNSFSKMHNNFVRSLCMENRKSCWENIYALFSQPGERQFDTQKEN